MSFVVHNFSRQEMKDEIYFWAFTDVYGDHGYDWGKVNYVYWALLKNGTTVTLAITSNRK